MAAGRYGSHRDREFDLKSSKYKPYNLDRDRYREDSRARGVDLRDHLSDRRRDRPPRDSLNGYSSGSGSDRGRRVVEREPGELYSSSESPGSRDDMRRKTEDATLSSPSKKRKVSPVSRVKDEKKKSSLAPALPPLSPNGHIAPRSVEQPAPALPKETGIEWWNDDREPGEMDAEDGENAPTRNISTSRWADANDFMDDVDEQAALNVRKDKSGSSEGSDGASSETSSSGAAQMDVEEGAKASDSQLSDTDSEEDGDGRAQTPEAEEIPEPEQPAGVVLNMMQGCRNVDEFERLNKINEGTYGVVYRAKDKKTGEIVALKKVKMEKEREGFPLTSLREMNILLSLRHPSIVGVKEVVVGSNLDSIFMVMEYMDHDLKALMEAMKQPFSQSEVKCLMLQLLEGVDYLHDNWVLHRDLKTSNLLMNNCGELKICDFGLSRQYGSPLKPYTHLVVTLWYRSPELLLGAKEYSTAIDMWSLGCIMAELLAKEPLFNGKTELDQLDKIFRILGTPNEKIWPGFTKLPGVKVNFVRQPYNKLRERFPPITTFSGRPTLSEAGFDLLNRLLTYDPVKRITAKDALNHPWFREIPLPKSKEFMPTYPAQNAHDRCKRRIMKSPDPLEEQRIRELQQGELGAGGIFG